MVYKDVNGGQQNPFPLSPGSRNCPTKLAPHLLAAVHHHTPSHMSSDMEESVVRGEGAGSLDRALMELLSRKHLDPGVPPSTYRALFPDAAGGILCEALNIMLEIVFLDRKCSLKVRKINILTKETQT